MNDQPPSQMMINQVPIMNQLPPPPPPPLPPQQVMSQQAVQAQLLMMNRGYNNNSNKQWPPLQQNPSKIGNFGSSKPRTSSNISNNNWKGKQITDKRNNKPMGMSIGHGSTQGYNPPTLHELQSQNRQKTRKFYPNKKKFNNNNNNNNRFAPYAPRNTTSFIIRAKKSGGIASLVSPCPVTPAVLPTPIFSPSREVLGDMAKEEWGVDGYGSMKGLIRLRSGNEHEDDDDDDEANGSSESDVEEHVEVERRLDHDLSRFEMIYPNYNGGVGGDYNNVLENRVDDQDSHIAQLEQENLTLKERLFFMERELADLRRRMQLLERQNNHHLHRSLVGVEDANEGIVESGSENESENGSDVCENKKENINEDVCMEDSVPNNIKKDEEVTGSVLVDYSMASKEDYQKKIENVDNEMDVEDESKDEQKQTVRNFEGDEVNVDAEKKEFKEEQVCIRKSIDGRDNVSHCPTLM